MNRILLVDDEEVLLQLLRIALEAEGFSVLEAHDGEEAVQIYTTITPKPDLVIMDHRMPRKNGLTALDEIKAFDPTAKIIFSSADDQIKQQAKSLGAIAFKKKPFGLDLFFANISKALSGTPMIWD